ncbi:hypothetical protein CDL15_Pgr013018 [Punica granatum]|uniref:RING-type domain-containing protein n=1 Tax=Punica granatum TaxID=22663 RepID=A0A218XF07_PUNGR|nr:hypothetical protein CDL15_Pgr013018 [Punica granatum]
MDRKNFLISIRCIREITSRAMSAGHRSNSTGAGNRSQNADSSRSKQTKAPITGSSSLKQVKKELDLVPKVKPSPGPTVGTITYIGSSRTRSYRRRIIQCEICAEKKQTCEMMRINKKCVHSFCSVCIAKHVKTRVADNQVTVPCPGLDCKHKVEYKVCVGILPKDVLDAWGKALCEALILEDHKFYCPFSGYISSEYAVDGLLSIKSAVFSFGVLVLEMVSGQRNRDFHHPDHSINTLRHAWKLWVKGKAYKLIDARMEDSSIPNSKPLGATRAPLE